MPFISHLPFPKLQCEFRVAYLHVLQPLLTLGIPRAPWRTLLALTPGLSIDFMDVGDTCCEPKTFMSFALGSLRQKLLFADSHYVGVSFVDLACECDWRGRIFRHDGKPQSNRQQAIGPSDICIFGCFWTCRDVYLKICV